jgi:cytochrome P450
MTEVQSVVGHSDHQVDDVLNRFIYSLYSRADGRDSSENPIAPIISEAGQIDTILRVPDRFHKNFSLIGALGNSRFSANGRDWTRRRGLTQATYAAGGTEANRISVAAAYAEALAGCDSNAPQAIQRALLAASAKIFFLAYGRIAATEPLLTFLDRARRVIKRLQYHSWLAPSAEGVSTLRAEAASLLTDFGHEMTRSPQLSSLMEELQRGGREIDDFKAVDEFLMNFLAGVETTAATLCFAIDRLGIDRRVAQRLEEEVDREECPYLECFLNETMRYFPAIPFVVRQVASDTAIDGTMHRAGQLVVLSVVGVHHDPKFWREPEIFDCSRAEFLGNNYDRRAFIPFLAGPRMCGGARLARMELTEGFKAFIRRFRVERKGDEIRFDYGVALRPNSWEQVEICRRSAR